MPTAISSKYRLGKKPPVFDNRTLQLAAYITPKLEAPPPTIDYSKAVKTWDMLGNDTLGDCTCAAAAHMIMEWSANTGKERSFTTDEVVKFYRHFSPAPKDEGADLLTVLKYWRSNGLHGDKVTAFAQLEPRSQTQVMDAVYLFGGCYIGVALPNFAVNASDPLEVPWVVPPTGPVGKDAAPNPDNGHCIPAVGYDQRNIYIVTWGQIKTMSWEFYRSYMDEAFAVLSTDWINKQLGTAPSGFDLAALQKDLQSITR